MNENDKFRPGKPSNVLPPINGKVEVDYQVLKQYETAAQAFMTLDPENAVAGVNIATMARDMFAVESEHNGEGVVGVDQKKLHEFVQLITGIKPVDVNVYYDNNGERLTVKI